LTTTVFPTANAGAHFLAKWIGGQLKGKDRCHDAVRFVVDAGLDRTLVEDLTVDGVGDSGVVVEAGVTGHDVDSPSVPHRLAVRHVTAADRQLGRDLRDLGLVDAEHVVRQDRQVC
jgi:hypothetical protein